MEQNNKKTYGKPAIKRAKPKYQNYKKVANPSQIEVMENKIELPNFTPVISGTFVSYGLDNTNYTYIRKCYQNSPTNAAIINTVSKLIVSEGLFDRNGIDIESYLSQEDVQKIALDYKMMGSYAIQVLWSADKTIGKITYLNVAKVFLEINNTGDVIGYYYSFDPQNVNKSNTDWYPKFDGNFKEFEDEKKSGYREILVVQRPDSDLFFPRCDYQSGLIWADMEFELGNTALSFSNQSFRGSTLVQMNSGIPPSEDLKRTYKKQIIDNLTGTSATGRVIISFNESSQNAMTVEQIELPEISKTFELFSSEAEQKLFVSHNVPPILFSGTKGGTGLGNNKEELESATASLMTRSINPMRKEIIQGLNKVFKHINPNISLEFRNFEVVVTKEKEEKEEI